MQRDQVTALILAGGQATRMGRAAEGVIALDRRAAAGTLDRGGRAARSIRSFVRCTTSMHGRTCHRDTVWRHGSRWSIDSGLARGSRYSIGLQAVFRVLMPTRFLYRCR